MAEQRSTDQHGRVTCERPWGRWTRLYFDGVLEVRKLEVKRGGYCTKHFHRTKMNVFVVVEGALRIFEWPTSYHVRDTELVSSNATLTVPPYVPHRFYGASDAVAYELALPVGCDVLDPEETEQLEPAGMA